MSVSVMREFMFVNTQNKALTNVKTLANCWWNWWGHARHSSQLPRAQCLLWVAGLILSLNSQTNTSISSNVTLYMPPWPSHSDLTSREPSSRRNVDKYFSAGFDFDRSLTIIIWLTSPQARAMKSSRHTDPTEGVLHCCFMTSLVSLYGVTSACRWQTMTMKMFCGRLTVPMLCCHNVCYLNIIRWGPIFEHAWGRVDGHTWNSRDLMSCIVFLHANRIMREFEAAVTLSLLHEKTCCWIKSNNRRRTF